MDVVKVVAVAVITYYTAGMANGIFSAMANSAAASAAAAGTTLTMGQMVGMYMASGAIAGAASGFAAGLIMSGGDMNAAMHGAALGAIGGALFSGAGLVGGPGGAASTERYLAHMGAGCVSAMAGGGKCGQGAIAAFAGKWMTNATDGLKLNDGAQFVAATITGGTVSVIGGGKFSNGAVTAAMGYVFNHLLTFNGHTVRYYDDDGKLIAEYPATSGRAGHTDPRERDKGPTPAGNYTINPSEIQERSFLPRLASVFRLKPDWGRYLVPLHADPGTDLLLRDSFYLHGGIYSGSAGCIDVGSYDVQLFTMLRNHSGPIQVQVNH